MVLQAHLKSTQADTLTKALKRACKEKVPSTLTKKWYIYY